MSIVRPTLALLAICLPCALPAAWAADAGAKEGVTVTLQGTKGEPVGEAVLTETPRGVLVTATLHDLPPGDQRSTSTSTGSASPRSTPRADISTRRRRITAS
jgi:Cu/Zn superoxide dismutase